MNKDSYQNSEEQFQAWARETAQAQLRVWNCQPDPDGEIFFTHSSLLWPVKRGDEQLMLKVAKPDDDEAHAADILTYFNGHGAVKLIAAQGSAQLLERIVPDKSVPDLEALVLDGRDDEATHIICDVIEKLHAHDDLKDDTALQNLIPFRSRSDAMRGHIDEGRVAEKDKPLFLRAYDLCNDFIAEAAGTERALHGDVHHFNVMHSAQRGWLAIDPKGIYGPRVYEYANTLCNPYQHDSIVPVPKRMERQAAIIAERAEVDQDQLLRFTFLHACQCGAWSLYEPDQGYWLACAQTAAQLAKITI